MERIFNKLILNSDYLQIPKCIFDEQDKLWSIFCRFSISYMGQQHRMVTARTGIYILRWVTAARPRLSGLIHTAGNPILCNAVISCYKCLQNPLEPGLWVWAHSSDFTVSQGTTEWVFLFYLIRLAVFLSSWEGIANLLNWISKIKAPLTLYKWINLQHIPQSNFKGLKGAFIEL